MFAKVPRKLQFVICFVVSTIAMACMGPSRLFGFSDSLFALVLVGWFVLTFMQAACFIPSLPEAVETYQVKHRIIPGVDAALDGRINDIMSSGYGFFYNLSSMLGPIIGGGLFSAYGFVSTLDANMVASGVVAIIFIVFNCGPNVFHNDREHKKVMKRMKKISRILARQNEFMEQERLKRDQFLADKNAQVASKGSTFKSNNNYNYSE